MVIKTELCAFSEYKIYPGKGSRFVTRTGQQVILSGSKSTSLYHQRKKPALLRWTQAWRRHHKKANVEGGVKRKTRRVIKVQRSYVGLGVDELNKKKVVAEKIKVATAPAAGDAKKAPLRQSTITEAKAKAKLAAAERKKAGGKAGQGQKMPVAQKHAGKGR